MTEQEKEKIYDEKIQPLMARILQICKESGIAISAYFEISPELSVKTHYEVQGVESAKMRLEYYLMQANGNLDNFIFACKVDGVKYGHSSAFLRMLEKNDL